MDAQHDRRRALNSARIFTAATLLSWLMSPAMASTLLCDTPVYRYALYRWSPTPYVVVAVARDESARKELESLESVVAQAAQSDEPANIAWMTVDPKSPDQLSQLPPSVRQALGEMAATEPYHVWVVAPHGAVIKDGALKADELESLLDSSARRKIRDEIEQAKAGVFVLLESPDHPKENAAALATIMSTCKEVAEGKVKLNTAPTVDRPEAEVIRVRRDDETEKGFVAQLLEIEPDLKSAEGPIVFLVFGRGRALFSCLGKGITSDNLARDIEFVAGACSCTVKEQNPGVDLLMKSDWETIAAVVSEKYQGEEGADPLLDGNELFPELVLQSEDDSRQEGAPEDRPTGAADGSGDPGRDDHGSDGATSDAASGSKKEDAATTVASVPTTPTASQPATEATPTVGLGRVVVGLGLVLLGLFAVTWLVLRPRG